MTTRELIEAVHPEPERIKVNEWWKGGFMTVKADDYDALRAATLAVLDDVIDAMLLHCDMAKKPTRLVAAYNLARALREKLR